MANKIKAAVVGYGNIGRYVVEALQVAPDFEIAGIVRRDASNVPSELKEYKVVSSIKELEKVHVAILCAPHERWRFARVLGARNKHGG